VSVAAGQTAPADSHGTVEMQAVEVVIRPMLTVNRAVDLFLADITRRGYSDRTRTSYSRTLDQFVDRLPVDLDVSKVTSDDISQFLDKWSRRARGTQAYNEAVVSSFFKFLYKSEKITRNPVDRLARTRRIPPAELDVVTVSNDDVRRMMMKAVSYPERMTIAVLALTGARRRAASRMRITDYDGENRMLTFREKGGKTVTRQISDDLDALIEEGLRDGHYADQDYLIPPEGPLVRPGDRDDRCIYDIVKRVAKRAGVECHAHALRAAFACFYLEANRGDIEGLKELLGHQSIQTTAIYLRKLDKKAAMERVRGLSWGVALTGIPSGSGTPEIADKTLAVPDAVGAGGFEPPWAESDLAKPDADNDQGGES
jgi:integrase